MQFMRLHAVPHQHIYKHHVDRVHEGHVLPALQEKHAIGRAQPVYDVCRVETILVVDDEIDWLRFVVVIGVCCVRVVVVLVIILV